MWIVGCLHHIWNIELIVSSVCNPLYADSTPLCVHSEDSCEDVMSSGEESLSSSLGSDAEGPYFPLHLRRKHLHAWRLAASPKKKNLQTLHL